MSLAYFPHEAANCRHCACLALGLRCCYCRFTQYMLGVANAGDTHVASKRVSDRLNAPGGHPDDNQR